MPVQRHIFIVHGRIGSLTTDADIISSDADFIVEQHWHQLLTSDGAPFDASRLRPIDWSEVGWGRSAAGDNSWFLDVTSAQTGGTDRFGRLRQALENIAATVSSGAATLRVTGRRVPLVAVSVIGVGQGGHDQFRGESIARLIEVCESFDSDGQPIDIAIVTPDRATHAALQQHRRERLDQAFAGVNLAEARRLGNHARNGTLALFIGAGASMPAGSPSWSGLLTKLAGDPDAHSREGFKGLNLLDQAQLLADRRSDSVGAGDGAAQLAAEVAAAIRGKSPALAHTLLAALNCREAVTTNYDNLYETAVTAAGGQVANLPGEPVSGDQPWILKLHGDLDRPNSIVLTRGQFVSFTSLSGPSGAILQSLLLTRHLLVVGASLADDNVLRLIHEVLEYRTRNGLAPVDRTAAENIGLGTVLDVDGDELRAELHSRYFRWETMDGADLSERARQLEIMLDAIGVCAGTNQSWLLDSRFTGLHDDDHRALVDQAATLYRALEPLAGEQSRWSPLLQALRDAGATQEPSPARISII